MPCSIDLISFDEARAVIGLTWPHVFSLPGFMRVWKESFSPESQTRLYLVRDGLKPVGVAPLTVTGYRASFIGRADVCDYLDFAIAPGRESDFFVTLLDRLPQLGLTELHLRCLRPESPTLTHLAGLLRERGLDFSLEEDGVSLEMDLPRDWDQYLAALSGKQRHEVRRKLRRLEESAEARFYVYESSEHVSRQLDTFLTMFRGSRADKAVFMNPQMESFFRSMLAAMAEEGVLKLFVLELNGRPAAANICFDYQGGMHLYNSAYDPDWNHLSAGLVGKILSIKYSIESGHKKYDFLKGAEPYKQRLGGRENFLSRCRLSLA